MTDERTALVVGCSRGIGLAVVRALLDEGFTVVGWSRRQPPLSGVESFSFVECDVRSHIQVEEAWQRTVRQLGGVPYLVVYNSGLGYFAEVERLAVSQWDEMFSVNVRGAYLVTRLVVPPMKERGSGHLVYICSVAGTNAFAGGSGYCASKFALRGFALSVFAEVRQYNIRVTVVNPGSVQTDFFSRVEGMRAEEWMLYPEDVAGAVLAALRGSHNFNLLEVDMRPLKPPAKK